ncbi:hypothetical protein [Moorena sp. SIO4G3]|uniref:hypothetical protein n=1 Tax=Moorena sp. SIO4G3 TaxID=2607821 RepID=UPI00142C31C8|nr:hypothetical protein [Moorena sp. SIO4G3]NEO81393.1 hypothetical protein [Moorena sp. SIO4G3]
MAFFANRYHSLARNLFRTVLSKVMDSCGSRLSADTADSSGQGKSGVTIFFVFNPNSGYRSYEVQSYLKLITCLDAVAHGGNPQDRAASLKTLLNIAFCLLPFAFCLLPFAFCLLPFAFCLLP